MSKRIPASLIDAALSTSEPAVATPSRRLPTSMRSQIETLDEGDCCSKLNPVDENMILMDYQQRAAEMREQLRNSLTSAVASAKESTGGTYTIEVGEMVMRNKLYLVAVVTRTA